MSEITEQLWIGAFTNVYSETFLAERNITHILCCAEEFKSPPGKFLLGNSNIVNYPHWHRLPIVDDVVDENTESQFREGAKKIDEWIRAGKKVIVHCYAGISRSVSTVITYLMIYKGWSYDIAFMHIKMRRPKMNPHPNFIPILMDISNSLSPREQFSHHQPVPPQGLE